MAKTVVYPVSADLSALLGAAVDLYVNTWSWMDWTEEELSKLSAPSDLDEVFR